MRRFAALFEALDASADSPSQLAALLTYLAAAPPADAAWAVHLLAGGKPRQGVPMALLRRVACQRSGIDEWLFDASHQAVGDLAETIAHVLPPPQRRSDHGLAHWVEQRLLPLRGLSADDQAQQLCSAFDELAPPERQVFVKLAGGGLRLNVSQALLQRALAQHAGIHPQRVAQRLLGWSDARASVSAQRLQALLSRDEDPAADAAQAYPFVLPQTLTADPATLGPLSDWLLEWTQGGLRVQLVRRAGGCWIWSCDDELMGARLPEISALAQQLPEGTVLEGEVLVWRPGEAAPASLQLLQQRLDRKAPTKKLLTEAPVVFIASELLQQGGVDLRGQPQRLRRSALEGLLKDSAWRLSPLGVAHDGQHLAAQRAQARQRGFAGLMLKPRDGCYGSGWMCKLDPLRADVVLLYAQAGHGRHAGVYTECTFAVWNRAPQDAAQAQAALEAIASRAPAAPGALQLLPVAKASLDLSDAERARVERDIRAHTLHSFGPVRSLRPTLVFELGFEGINRSARHKSGIVVRLPRTLRIRHDKAVHEADALPALQALMA